MFKRITVTFLALILAFTLLPQQAEAKIFEVAPKPTDTTIKDMPNHFVVVPETLKLYANGKELDPNWIQDSNGTIYVSLGVLKESGSEVNFNPSSISATVTEKNGTSTKLSVMSYMVDRNGKKIILHTEKINGVVVPSGNSPQILGDQFMIPAESITQLFGQAVTTKKVGNEIVVHVGKVVTPKPEPSKPAYTTIKEDPRYPFPSKHTPQPITSKWTNSKVQNLKNMANELGDLAFLDAKPNMLEFKPQGRGSGSITVYSYGAEFGMNHEASIWVTDWPIQGYSVGELDYNNSIPYALKEVLTFYLGKKDGTWVYNEFDKARTSKKNGTSHGKQVKLGNRYIQLDVNRQTIEIGKPNEKYDKYWRGVIK